MTKPTREQLSRESDEMKPALVERRRDFHMHPELAFNEVRTAGIVAARLGELGYEVTSGVGKTGVVAVMEGSGGMGETLLLRFDMDALPIREQVDVPFKSKTDGIMHACGHDAHTAIGLGVAEIMARYKTSWHGVAKFVFQPAEEIIAGAAAMIKDGVLENPKPTRTLSMHVNSMEPVGQIQMADGPSMAGGDPLEIVVQGRGTHGASPHLGVDPIVAAAHILVALQTIVSRNIDPLKSAVITIGSIHGGSAGNIVPDTVHLTGTLRTFDADVRKMAMRRIAEITEGTAISLGCSATVTWGANRVPATVSHPKFAEVVRLQASGLQGITEIDTTKRTMGSEDCSWFLEAAPGAYVHIGAAMRAPGANEPHHSPRFEINEDSMPLAVALLSASAMELLGGS